MGMKDERKRIGKEKSKRKGTTQGIKTEERFNDIKIEELLNDINISPK